MKENINQKVEIRSKEPNSIFTEIFIDGKKIDGVRSYKVECQAGNNIPVLTLELNALNLSIDKEMIIYSKDFNAEIIIKECATANGANS